MGKGPGFGNLTCNQWPCKEINQREKLHLMCGPLTSGTLRTLGCRSNLWSRLLDTWSQVYSHSDTTLGCYTSPSFLFLWEPEPSQTEPARLLTFYLWNWFSEVNQREKLHQIHVGLRPLTPQDTSLSLTTEMLVHVTLHLMTDSTHTRILVLVYTNLF